MNHFGKYCISIFFVSQFVTIQSAKNESKYGEKKFNEWTWLTSHNSHINWIDNRVLQIAANQNVSIDDQLKYGVRGLMLDIDNKACSFLEKLIDTCTCEGICLCHGECSKDSGNAIKDGFSVKNLEYVLKKIVRFLDKNKDEIITIFLEDYLPKTKQLQNVFDKVKGFNELVFNPYSKEWNITHKGWPKIKDLIKTDKRLLIVDDEQRGEHARKYPGIIRYSDFFIENHYKWFHNKFQWDVKEILNKSSALFSEIFYANRSFLINNTILEVEMSDCFSRQSLKNQPTWHKDLPLENNNTVNIDELVNSEKLFLFNHFYGVTAMQALVHPVTVKIMNKKEFVLARLKEKCDSGTNKKKPNYIALDFIDEYVYDDLIKPLNEN